MTDRERMVERALSVHENLELVKSGLEDRLHKERLSNRERTAVERHRVHVEDVTRRLWQAATQARKALQYEDSLRPVVETLTALLQACTAAEQNVAARNVPRGVFDFMSLSETTGNVSSLVEAGDRNLSKWISKADHWVEEIKQALADADQLDDHEAEAAA